MTRAFRAAMVAMAALMLVPASSLAADVAVLGNNSTDEVLTAAGHNVTLVTDAQVATPGFLDGFDVFFFTRGGGSFNATLSAGAAAQARAFTRRAVLLNGDFADDVAGDPEIRDLFVSSVLWAAERGGGYVGELEGATAGLSANGDGQPVLNFIAGTAAQSQFTGNSSTIEATAAGADHPVLDGVALPHTAENVEFAAAVTGAPAPKVLARYANNSNPAILATDVQHVAVLGNNSTDEVLNQQTGIVAELVSDAQVAQAGFLGGFDGFIFTRGGGSFNATLSNAAADRVKAFAKRVVLLNGDFADSLGDDQEIRDLLVSSVRWAIDRGGGYIGELEGATAGLSANGDGQPALNFIPGTAAQSQFTGNDSTLVATSAGAAHPALDGVSLPHTAENVEFAAAITGAPAAKVLARYALNNNPAVLATELPLDQRRMVTNTTTAGTTYASIVECNAEQANAKARPFQLQWSSGGVQKFVAKAYRDVRCFDDSSVAGAPNGFDTQTGEADGTLNGVAGFRITWTIVDGGATANDRIQARIVRLSDGAVIRTISGTPSGGTGHTAMGPTP